MCVCACVCVCVCVCVCTHTHTHTGGGGSSSAGRGVAVYSHELYLDEYLDQLDGWSRYSSFVLLTKAHQYIPYHTQTHLCVFANPPKH